MITVRGDRLRYRIPKIDVAVFNVPAADRRGSLYVKHSAIIGDSYEIARAAKRNRGRGIANVGLIADEGYDRVFLPADMVDAVVYYPDTEQTAGVSHHDYWPMLTTDSDVSIAEGPCHSRRALPADPPRHGAGACDARNRRAEGHPWRYSDAGGAA